MLVLVFVSFNLLYYYCSRCANLLSQGDGICQLHTVTHVVWFVLCGCRPSSRVWVTAVKLKNKT